MGTASGVHVTSPVVLQRLDLRGVTGELRGLLPRPQAQVEPPIDEVRALLADVRVRGDVALRELTDRITALADEYQGSPRDDVAADLYEVERSLQAAHRRLMALLHKVG